MYSVKKDLIHYDVLDHSVISVLRWPPAIKARLISRPTYFCTLGSIVVVSRLRSSHAYDYMSRSTSEEGREKTPYYRPIVFFFYYNGLHTIGKLFLMMIDQRTTFSRPSIFIANVCANCGFLNLPFRPIGLLECGKRTWKIWIFLPKPHFTQNYMLCLKRLNRARLKSWGRPNITSAGREPIMRVWGTGCPAHAVGSRPGACRGQGPKPPELSADDIFVN